MLFGKDYTAFVQPRVLSIHIVNACTLIPEAAALTTCSVNVKSGVTTTLMSYSLVVTVGAVGLRLYLCPVFFLPDPAFFFIERRGSIFCSICAFSEGPVVQGVPKLMWSCFILINR